MGPGGAAVVSHRECPVDGAPEIFVWGAQIIQQFSSECSFWLDDAPSCKSRARVDDHERWVVGAFVLGVE
jgi:hypothetical protein